MSCFTAEEANAFYLAAKEAYTAVLTGKQYKFKGRELTRHDVDEIKREMFYWKKYKDTLDAGGDPDAAVVIEQGIPVDINEKSCF